MIENRIQKNFAKLKAWSEKHQIEAYRLYDRDIPEFPFIVDRYKDFFVIHDKSQQIDAEKNHLPLLITALKTLFQITDDSKILFKQRRQQKGLDQYQKLGNENKKIVVKENGVQFLVNLWDYLDTGLFLDHRPMRYQILKEKKSKRFLNLFCYTGSVSVVAALAGNTTYSVDMSGKYLDWAQDNFKQNGLDPKDHFFFEEDVLEFIKVAKDRPDFKGSFDTIFLDPPTFSNSKKMDGNFEVERDQDLLVENLMPLLKSDGILYFSNNKRDFKLSKKLESTFKIKNITAKSIPIDFHDQKIHHCFEIKLSN
ncbi:MAG: class I SAM-dependent methyltransferase [Bdellovibrio sp.]|nr:class I SAM-dependent methyltransferase [Bdellovibrio sp.]